MCVCQWGSVFGSVNVRVYVCVWQCLIICVPVSVFVCRCVYEWLVFVIMCICVCVFLYMCMTRRVRAMCVRGFLHCNDVILLHTAVLPYVHYRLPLHARFLHQGTLSSKWLFHYYNFANCYNQGRYLFSVHVITRSALSYGDRHLRRLRLLAGPSASDLPPRIMDCSRRPLLNTVVVRQRSDS